MKTNEIIVSKHLAERLKDIAGRAFENELSSDNAEKQGSLSNTAKDFSKLNKRLFNMLMDKMPEYGGKGFFILANPFDDFLGCFVVLNGDNFKIQKSGLITKLEVDIQPLADLMHATVLNDKDIGIAQIIDDSSYVSGKKNSKYYFPNSDNTGAFVSSTIMRKMNSALSNDLIKFYLLRNALVNVALSTVCSVENIFISKDNKLKIEISGRCSDLQKGGMALKIKFPDYFNFSDKDTSGSIPLSNTKRNTKKNIDDVLFQSELLLHMDSLRAKFPPLSPYRLKSVSEGSVELMSGIQVPDGYVKLTLDDECVARDPWELVQEGSLVSIDFGTTSTVVAFQNTMGYVELLRMKSFGQEISESDFENPTVLEFNNYKRFYDTWTNEDYRPLTEWNDVCASYDAKEQLRDHACCGVANIKTWAVKRHNSIPLRLEDETNQFPFELSPLDVDEDPNKDIGNWKERYLDPIEVYGYYLGLFLNNQALRGGAIYLDYRLTFPVDFDKESRNRIKQGLRRGILRSLPPSLIYSDRWHDARFNIELSATEPVALVSSVIPALGLDKDLEKPLAYAVFDFGGGTTDFSAGLYRRSTDEEADEYDCDITIQTLAVGGMKDLGGEHILDHLYYAVLRDNALQLMRNNISFVCPPNMNRFPGSDTLWGYGSDAFGNMYVLRDRLRPVWENRTDDIQSIETEGKLSVQLKNASGDYVNMDLDIDCETLKNKIYELIRAGVISFFTFFCQAFKQADDKGVIDKIHILFSGNSCRTPILREVFAEQKEKNLNVSELDAESKKKILDRIVEHYELIDQTMEHAEVKNDNLSMANYVVQDENEIKVTLKNCVALGLLKLLTSSIYTDNTYLNNSESSVENEAPFDYYIGKFKSDFLEPIFMKNTPYNEWKLFDRVRKARLGGEPSIQIGWSNSPVAAAVNGGKVKRNGCKSTIIYFSQELIGNNIYMRAVNPHKIEIACFSPQDANYENPLMLKDVNL